MRIQIEVGDRSVDLEDNTPSYESGEARILRGLIEHALASVGYSVYDLFVIGDQNESS